MIRIFFFSFISLMLFCSLTTYAQSSKEDEVIEMDEINVSSSKESDQKEVEETKWGKFDAEECGVNVNMPTEVTLSSDSTAYTSNSFIKVSTYQSTDLPKGSSYTVMCYRFPTQYPFKENAENLLKAVNKNLKDSENAKILSDKLIELYNQSGRQFVIKIGERMSFYGRAIIIGNTIISLVSSQVKDLNFTDPELRSFFDSVKLTGSN